MTANEDVLDFPTAWEIQREIGVGQDVHHEDCSAATTMGAFLCDCGAVENEWARRGGRVPMPDTSPTPVDLDRLAKVVAASHIPEEGQ